MKIVLVVFFYFSFCVYSFGQDFEWAKSMGGTGSYDYGRSIATDANGNVYVTGFFEGTVDFDPGIGTFNLVSNGIDDIFIQKLDANGNFIWAISMGGTDRDYGNDIAIDANGNAYITGFFEGTVDFNPGAGTFNLTSDGSYTDIFILKLTPNGDFSWAKRLGSYSTDYGTSIALDDNNNVYTTGVFENTVDFNPNSGTFNLTSTGYSDVFIQKLSSSGAFIWAKAIEGSTATNESPEEITIDAGNNVYTTGFFKNTADFNPGSGTFNLTSSGDFDIFIQKLDVNGNFVWAKKMGSSGADYGYGITTDINGNVYTTGHFHNTVDFNPNSGSFNLTSSGGSYTESVFIQKLSSNGSFIWAKKIGGNSNYYANGNGIVTDASGSVYTIGSFGGLIDFDPSTSVLNQTSNGLSRDFFIQKLDANGNFVWVRIGGGTSLDRGESLCIDYYNNIYTVGTFSLTVDFNPNAGVYDLTSNGSSDIFIQKLNQCNPTTGTDTETACNSYTWINGITYTSSNNTAIDTLTNTAGCDSIVTLDLTILTPTTGTDIQTTCNPYTWINGMTYTSNNNTATDTLMNVLGCDSIVTLDLTILGGNNLPYQEDFTGTFPSFGASILNPDNSNTWVGAVWTATNGATDDVMYIDYSAYNAPGQRDYFVLPLLDLDTVTIAELSFDVSYNPYGVLYSDSLAVEISTDCGLTYQSVYMKGGLDLSIDNSYLTSVWIPDNAADWRKERIDLSAYLGSNILVRFVGINGYGNNLYLDNINVGAPVMTNVEEVPTTEIIKIYPTPTKDYLIIELIENSQDIQLEIVDVNGRIVLSQGYQEQSKIQLSVEHLTTGIYFVKIESNKGVQIAKMLKE